MVVPEREGNEDCDSPAAFSFWGDLTPSPRKVTFSVWENRLVANKDVWRSRVDSFLG